MELKMGHYAFINEDNIVTQVITGKDEQENGIDWEQYYGNLWKMNCKRTSYNTRHGQHINGGIPFRKNYAGIGFKYDEARDAFIPPQPFASWVLNEETCDWEAPYPAPDDGIYTWQEPQGWVKQPTTEIPGA
jgi:hypothetical protein